MKWLCEEYYRSAEYQRLSARTKVVRRAILERFCVQHGHKPYKLLERKHLLLIRDKMADRPEAANGLMKALRQVFSCALDREHVDTNPAANIRNLSSSGDGIHAWSLAEVEQFEQAHPVGTKARLALALLLYTCQRRSDIVTLGRQHVREGWLRFTQAKNRERAPITIEIPILPALQEVIDRSPTGDMTFLITDFKKPFTSNGFGNKMRKWCDQAGLPQCSAHGLRKAAACRMAELGCTDHEIMAIGGWKTLKQVQRYTAAARQKTMAGNAADKLIAGQQKNKSV